MNWSEISLTISSTSTPRCDAVVTAYRRDSSGTKYGLVNETRLVAEYSSEVNIRRLFSVVYPGPLGRTWASTSHRLSGASLPVAGSRERGGSCSPASVYQSVAKTASSDVTT